MSDTPEQEIERGVKNPKVVDLISVNPTSGEIVLTMIEDRPWGESEEQLDQLQEKVNNYMDYILDGWIYSHYPQYSGKPCSIRVSGAHPPDDEQSKFFTAIERCCKENGIGFELV